MKKKLLSVLLALAVLVSCLVPTIGIFAEDSVPKISDSTNIPGKTLWSFDGASVSAVPAGWEVERGTGTASVGFWGALGVSSLSYNAAPA
ncbi:MAG: hypothetical protein IJW27_01700 [Clostridia bacterium]|nr:hypothetical protein [Clostridia bacterium]